jgi:hypothetical protein
MTTTSNLHPDVFQTAEDPVAASFGVSFEFRIPTADAREVFMRVDRSNFMMDERAVVEVDASRFLALWRNSPNRFDRELSFGTPATWSRHYLYSEAEQSFAFGRACPVRLPRVVCGIRRDPAPVRRERPKWWPFSRVAGAAESRESQYVAFDDGADTTLWLLNHGAKRFPVECSISEAPLLQEHAGPPGSSVKSVAELLPEEVCSAALMSYLECRPWWRYSKLAATGR